jgi:4-amino-4-deoxy-L-arabinose transferase-like glycosyltransferase
LAAIALLVGVAVLRFLYLAFSCPLDLAPDEAHYWDWSRNLDWSYYSKGPVVAYLIRGSCWLAGPCSTWLTGSEMLAVRLPAVLCNTLLLVSLYILTVQVYQREKLALAVLVLALPLPVLAAGGSLMTIDAPYCCCWGWALVLGFQAVFRNARWAWPALGLVIGLGILAKYTMVLFPLSLGLFLLATPAYRPFLRRPGFWIMAGISALCCLPIVIWNARNNWVTFSHLLTHSGFQRETVISWLGPIIYIGGQFALLLGYYFLVWVRAMVRHRPGLEQRPEIAYLWWLSLPTFVFFLVFSLKNGGGELNWPITAYLSGMILAVAWLGDRLAAAPRLRRLATLSGLAFVSGISLGFTLLLHHSALAHPLLERFCQAPTRLCPTPMRRLDPTCRLKGWQTLAAEVDQLREQCRRTGDEPIVVSARWSEVGELGFYCQGQPTVYSIGLAHGDRYSQYDLWRPNPLADPDLFVGKTFIIVNSLNGPLDEVFDRLDAERIVTHYEGGHPLAQWKVVVGYGFRGFPNPCQGKAKY